MTATQRALALESENRLLESTRDGLQAEVQRLTKQLEDNRELLMKAQQGINTARTELRLADQANAELKNRIIELESDKQALALESKRQMDSIRQKLDNVLMREMAKQ